MGCDIHIYPERLENGKWITAEPFTISKWWAETIIGEDEEFNDEKCAVLDKLTEEEILEKYSNDSRFIWDGPWDNDYNLHGRNYRWFSILANVRNGYGFAGSDTGDEFRPIDMPRSLPNNVSFEVKRQSDQDGIDGHSHSWFTLCELLDYDWDNQFANQRGVVGISDFKTFLKNGYPRSWCNSVGGIKVKMISNEEMKQLVFGCYGLLDTDMEYYTKVEWRNSYRECVGDDYLQRIFDKLSEYGKPEEVRIVFWFDN